MPPRRRESSGYRGVREHPSGAFYGEIRSGDVRLGLGTFETTHEAARVYDAAAWSLQRPRAQMNFQDVWTCEQAQAVAPPPRLITDQDCEEHRWRQRRLLIVEEDKRAMAEWRQRHRRTSPTRTPSGQRGRQGAAQSGRTGIGGRHWPYRSLISLTQVGSRSLTQTILVGKMRGSIPRTTPARMMMMMRTTRSRF
nr:ethylene-responsive transcription factor ERF010 [Aegilops tauschii subsp. strangulata]